MTDMEKVMKLFDELGIKYEVNGDTLYVETEVDVQKNLAYLFGTVKIIRKESFTNFG